MRLSAWHMEIAKLIAQGKPNREIKLEIKVCDSRLSVLRANPLMQREVSKWKRIYDDKYKQALDVMVENAVKAAQQVVELATLPMTPPAVKLNAAKLVLEEAAKTSDIRTGSGQEVVFEQLLRVTKRQMGTDQAEDDTEFDGSEVDSVGALSELMQDLEPVLDDSDLIDLQPLQVSFKKQVEKAIEMGAVDVLGDNGGEKKYQVSPRLMELLKQ